MRTNMLALLLLGALIACAPAGDGAQNELAREPIARENPSADKKPASLLETSQAAYAVAEKACRGCEDRALCQRARGAALQAANDAIRATASGTGDLERRQTETMILGKQFKDLGKLEKECRQ